MTRKFQVNIRVHLCRTILSLKSNNANVEDMSSFKIMWYVFSLLEIIYLSFQKDSSRLYMTYINQSWFGCVYIVNDMLIYHVMLGLFWTHFIEPRRWRSGLMRLPCGRFGVRIQLKKTKVVKIGSHSFTAKRSAIGASVTGPRRWPLYTDAHMLQ